MTKTGNVMWFAVSWQPLMDPDGKASSFRMSMRDIADRKRMEQGLHKAMIRLGIKADQFRT
jgi:PAS domain S-box-containing protein